MKRAKHFVIGPNWRLMLRDMQIDTATVLNYAGLPADFLHRGNASLAPEAYFKFWRAIERAAGDRELALLLVEHFKAEAFDAPIFASLCSPDFNTAATRLSHYKPLIGPMVLDVAPDRHSTRLRLSCYGTEAPLPNSLCLTELVFFGLLIRAGTREHVIPQAVRIPELPRQCAPYEQFFGCALTQASHAEIVFASVDAALPFLTANSAMWAFFEDGLNRQLAALALDASTTERVRAVLLEALPGGVATIEAVATRLYMSKRTLQRKLMAEASSFQALLTATRVELAEHYLRQSRLSLAEISFLLGFQEPNSFIRSYQSWTGHSPGMARATAMSVQ